MTALFSSCEQPNRGASINVSVLGIPLLQMGTLPPLGVVEFHIPRIPYLVVQVERAEQPIFFSSHLQIHHIVSVGGVWLAWSPKGLNSHPIPPFPKPLKSYYCKVDKFIGKGRILSFSFNSTMSPITIHPIETALTPFTGPCKWIVSKSDERNGKMDVYL